MSEEWGEMQEDKNAVEDEVAFEVAKPKRRGLGRGLNALFEDGEGSAPHAADMQENSPSRTSGSGRQVLSVDQLVPNKHQPRQLFNDDSLNELADSIREHGILQPLLVRLMDGEEERYEIIAGERRWRASQIAQLHEVPVIITQHDNAKMQEIALIENLQREDLNPVDEAAGYKYMMDEYGYTQELLAKKMGKSRSHISNMLRLNNLSENVAWHLAKGDISMGHARALASAEKPDKLVTRVVEENLSVRDTEKMVQRVKAATDGTLAPAQKKTEKAENSSDKVTVTSRPVEKDADTLALEKRLSDILGMRVSIDAERASPGRGTLSITYRALDQLDYVLEKLSYGSGLRLNK